MPADVLLPTPNASANMRKARGKHCMLEGGGSDNGADAKVPKVGPITNATSAVFVSYASQDSGVAEGLCAALERNGIGCWIAPRDVRPGDYYADAIVQAINACQLLLLVLSASSSASPHVVREVERASSKRRPIITFRIDAAALPPGLEYFLSASQWLDASAGPAEHSFPKLIDAIKRRSAGDAVPMTARSAGDEASRVFSAAREPARSASTVSLANRSLIAALVVLGVALAYVLADKFWLSQRVASQASNRASLAVPASIAAAASASQKSVVVLPFRDLSEQKDQEYFSDGLSEELIDLLGKIPGLRVPARTSSFYFKGKQTTLGEIAQSLQVAHVLEGSVRKAGSNVRITADLVRVNDEAQLWSETYDRKLDDIFKLQDEIAGAVVKALKLSLLAADTPKATPAANIDGYTLYLQGRALVERYNFADNLKGQEFLQQALKLDPNFAPTWAELARARLLAFAAFGESNYQTSHAGTLEAAKHALTLDPELAFAHAVLGQELFAMDWDWGAAERELHRAIELDPGDPGTLALASQFALSQGRYTEAQRLAQSTIARDPLGIPGYRHLGNADYFAGDLVAAEAAFRKVLELYPAADGIRYKLALVLLSRGDAQGALGEMEHERHAGWRQQGLPLALDALGRKADADRALAAAEKDAPQGWAYQLALSYAHRKSFDQAFAWLDQAYRQHDVGLSTYLVGDPLFANMRTDARFKALLHKLKLPE